MELRIVNENPNYPPVKLIEPTPLGYIHLAAVVQPRQVSFLPAGREKAQLLARIKHFAHQLEQLDMVEKVRVFHSIVMAPPTGCVSNTATRFIFHAMTSWCWLRQHHLKLHVRCRKQQRI